MRLQTWLDVLGFGTRADDTEANGLVVLELEVEDGFDDGLTHGESVLRLALLDDAEAGCCVVRSEQSVQGKRNLHGTRHPDNIANREPVLFRFVGGKGQHALNLVPVERTAHQSYSLAHAMPSRFSCFIIRSTVATMVWVMASISMFTR